MKKFDKVINYFEIGIAILLFIVIIVKIIDFSFVLLQIDAQLLSLDFENILIIVFNFVIGAEFIRLLVKHNVEALTDVLLFAIVRKMVLPSSSFIELIAGVASLAAVFAIRKYLFEGPRSSEDDDLAQA